MAPRKRANIGRDSFVSKRMKSTRRLNKATQLIPKTSEQKEPPGITGKSRARRTSPCGLSCAGPNKYKIAMVCNVEVDPHYLGPMDAICTNCNAKHFRCEMTDGDTRLFSMCCEKGKFTLPAYNDSPLITKLLEGRHCDSANFMKNIRSYNAALAMVSTGLQSDEQTGRGPYYLRIHGGIYHQIGSLMPEDGRDPTYAQLYIYDTNEGCALRMKNPSNLDCKESLMSELIEHITGINPYAQSFKSMFMAMQANPQNQRDIRMYIFNDRKNDPRRYNLPATTDVAAIFESTDGGPSFANRHVVVQPFEGCARMVSMLSNILDPLAYPILFPYGDPGWHCDMQQNNPRTNSQKKVSQNKYAAYRLSVRERTDNFHKSGKLFLQWIVDMYVRIEAERLNFIRNHQRELRRDMYLNIYDYVHNEAEQNQCSVGRVVVLPSSFVGSPRNMYERYQDAMSIVRVHGKPDLFITFTCNPKWEEITEALSPGETTHCRPDIVARVFHKKLKALIEDIKKGKIFGTVAAVIYTIEFQKRGLPHAHILISLAKENKIVSMDEVDKIVSAEIPDLDDPLRAIVAAHMIHGPCGTMSTATPSPCMGDDGKCKKHFPRDWSEETCQHANGYPIYRRRNDGRCIVKSGRDLDNRWVVPYNRYLLLKYNAHINVEICTTVKSVKYIYKYIYKGNDACTLAFQDGSAEYDEIRSFINARYVGSVEAAWRIFEFEMHYQSAVVYRLNCHLEHMQSETFVRGNEAQALANPRNSKLTAWFILNQEDVQARQYLYTEIPQHYTWNSSDQKWKARKSNSGDRVITRLYTVNPKNTELFYLRLLLLHTRGATSYDDLRLHASIKCATYQEACISRGLASSDSEWKMALSEAIESKGPRKIRQLFAFIVAINCPTCPLALWEDYKIPMSEDFARNHSLEDACNIALHEIDDILLSHNTSCEMVGLPSPRLRVFSDTFMCIVESNALTFEQKYEGATIEQKHIIDEVVSAILSNDTTTPKMFYLDAPAGCGKTYVQETLRCYMKSQGRECIVACYTGIAASLIEGGRTLHNVFKLPVPLLETSVPDINCQSTHADWLRKCELIIIDEASMVPSVVLTIIDRLLRDITGTNLPLGGKVVFLSGDFRQTLPVVPHGGRALTAEACIKKNYLWKRIRQMRLKKNLRVETGEDAFAAYLIQVGNGCLPRGAADVPFSCKLHPDLLGDGCPIDYVYKNNEGRIDITDDIVGSAILAPRNIDCADINNKFLSLLPNTSEIYTSVDVMCSDDVSDHVNFPTEFLNSIEISGLPAHNLELKKNAIVMLMRNLHTTRGLINGTRMQIIDMLSHSIECKVLTGASKGDRVLIPRIKLSTSPGILPFSFSRCQIPVAVAFAMTINKSQGQSLSKVGIYLKDPVFSHGQLYVALSRGRSFRTVKVFVEDGPHQDVSKGGVITTKNVVFPEVL